MTTSNDRTPGFSHALPDRRSLKRFLPLDRKQVGARASSGWLQKNPHLPRAFIRIEFPHVGRIIGTLDLP
jgi:hypothetical protein